MSNGGGASLRAAEQDSDHLIDGVAVAEPNLQPMRRRDRSFGIRQGSGDVFYGHSKSLESYITFENLYAGCAAVAQGTAAPLNLAASPGRCDALAAAGLLTPAPPQAEAMEAQQKLNAFGLLPEQNFVSPSHWFAYVHQSISVTYTNQYGRFSVLDDLCGISMGATDAAGQPIPLAPTSEDVLFGLSNGIPPSAGVNLINDEAPSGPREDRVSTADQDLRGALCLRSLAQGTDASSGAALGPAEAEQAQRVRRGVRDVRATGDLHGVPAVYVVGRNDGVLPPNFTGRAYYGLNQTVEGEFERAALLRGHERAASRHLQPVRRVRQHAHSAAPLFRASDGPDVRASHDRRGAAAEPGRAYDPSRFRCASDHLRERAAHRGRSAPVLADHVRQRRAADPGLTPERRLPRQLTAGCPRPLLPRTAGFLIVPLRDVGAFSRPDAVQGSAQAEPSIF